MDVVGSLALTGYNPHSVQVAHNVGFAYSHSRGVSGGQVASVLVYDIGGGSAGGTKTAPVLIGAFADGGGAGSCGIDVTAKSSYCGSLNLSVTGANSYYADNSDYAAGILSVDLKVSNGGSLNALDVILGSYSADNGVTAATATPKVVGNIPAGSNKTVTVKYNLPNGVTSFTTSYNLTGKDLCAATTPASGSKPVSVPAQKDYYFTWYDNNAAAGMNGDWITINNIDNSDASASIYIGDGATPQATLGPIAPGGSVEWQSPTPITDGPVRIVSENGQKLRVTQRVIYKDSFNEIEAVEKSKMESEYHFTWYDNNAAWGMNGNWIVVNNAGATAANVEITIGGTKVATLSVPAGGQQYWQSPTTLIDGPIKVKDTNGQPLLVSQRVIYMDSFNEVLGVPVSKLGSEAWVSWYDNNAAWGMNGNWICINNGGGATADVEVRVNGDLKETLTIPAGGSYEWQSPTTLTDGPVQVKDKNGGKLMVSRRAIYMASFDEINGVRKADLGDNADLNWYDNNAAWGMNGDWIIGSNLGTQATNMSIKIGGTQVANEAIAPGARSPWQSPTTLTDGPIRVTSNNGQKLLVSQRVIYKNSFNELVGSPRA
jgi:hypothetical protein